MEVSVHDPWTYFTTKARQDKKCVSVTGGLAEPKNEVAKERYDKLIAETDMSNVKVEKM